MPTIAEVRKQYPQYQDLSDDQLAGALHKKFYSDMPAEEFRAKIGLKPPAPNRIAQAFDVASDPIADQSLRPDYNQYGFTENMMRSLPFGDEAARHWGAISRASQV